MMILYRKRELYRVLSVMLVFILLFTACFVRIYSIQNNSAYLVADMQFTKTISLGKTRGYIYDCNMKPLVNICKERRYIMLNNSYTSEYLEEDSVEIKEGIYVIVDDESIIQENEYVRSFNKINRYTDSLCTHIVGYVDSDNKGVCGIEKAFDKILNDASGELYLSFSNDANGNILSGDGISLENMNYDSVAGVRLTIDRDIQSVAENVLKNSQIEKGAVVILDSKTAEIRAIASVPVYDVNNLEESLYDNDSPFLNRALSAYPVGSVFKPVVAAAVLESGDAFVDEYYCDGSIQVGKNNFTCYNYNSHGVMNLNKAIEKSCNAYFINSGLKIGADNICDIVEKFGFSSEINLCSTLISSSGYFPEEDDIQSDSDLANLCFGQGSLLATPLQLAAAYNVFANDGIYMEPVILKELMDAECKAYAYYESEKRERIISSKSCETINNCLYNNMLNGTGVAACSDMISSAGKTATAQTGRYDENGKELLCTWFCGFFPFEDPLYTIVVFNEEGSIVSQDCAPVFKSCIEQIYELIC